ncbi:MAG TPA: FadR/GntR family transcriptional regulator [Desulfomonilia bacterium]|jgi:GntR family transcriptional repressor for pyruvate dehydrogenase complex
MEPLVKMNLSESLAKIIIEQIKDGLLAPGSRLPTEKELMTRYSVGRSSVREAFQSLAIMGVLETHPGQGTFVRDVSRNIVVTPHIFSPLVGFETSTDFLEARLLIEPAIAGLAAKRHSQEEYDELSSLLDKCEKNIAANKSVTKLNGEFHVRIAHASHNIVFVRFIEAIIRMLIALGESLENDPEYLKWELASHRDVLSAIRSRKARNARLVMEKHIRQVSKFHSRLDPAEGRTRI